MKKQESTRVVLHALSQRCRVGASNDPTLPAGTTGTMHTEFLRSPTGELFTVQRFQRDPS
jgi:hypothetical protein